MWCVIQISQVPLGRSSRSGRDHTFNLTGASGENRICPFHSGAINVRARSLFPLNPRSSKIVIKFRVIRFACERWQMKNKKKKKEKRMDERQMEGKNYTLARYIARETRRAVCYYRL